MPWFQLGWIFIGFFVCIFGLYHALLYLLLFFHIHLPRRRKKITLISRGPICQYVGFLNFPFFFCYLRDTRAAKLFTFQGSPIWKYPNQPCPQGGRAILETLATRRGIRFVPELDFILSFEGNSQIYYKLFWETVTCSFSVDHLIQDTLSFSSSL